MKKKDEIVSLTTEDRQEIAILIKDTCLFMFHEGMSIGLKKMEDADYFGQKVEALSRKLRLRGFDIIL